MRSKFEVDPVNATQLFQGSCQNESASDAAFIGIPKREGEFAIIAFVVEVKSSVTVCGFMYTHSRSACNISCVEFMHKAGKSCSVS